MDRARASVARYDAVLSPNLTLLTQRQRLDDALLLKTKRDEVQKAWLPAAEAPAAPAARPAATPAPKPLGSGTITPGVDPAAPDTARKVSPWRDAATWALEAGGLDLRIDHDGKGITVRDVKDLPPGKFDLTAVHLPNAPKPGAVTDAALNYLIRMRELTSFEGGIPEVKGPGLEFLRTTPKLTRLVLDNASQIKDEHLAPLSGLKDLENLVIQKAALTGAALTHLAGCKKLQTLDLNGLALTAGDASKLHTMFPDLKTLHLGPDSLNEETLRVVGQFTWLESLDLGGNAELTDGMLAPLSGLTGLRSMDFNGCTKFNGTGLAAFAGSGELRRLNVTYGNAHVNGAALPVIAKTFPKLEDLIVAVRNVTDEDFKALCRHPSLKDLNLYATPVTDNQLAAIATLPRLQSLNIGGDTHTAAGIEHLLISKNLTTLVLKGGKNMDASVVPVLKKFTKLKSLNLKDTAAKSAADEIRKALPGCKVIDT